MKFKKIVCGIGLVVLMQSASAFSFGRFLTNPFNVSITSWLNPSHVMYVANIKSGLRPDFGISKYAFTERDRKNIDFSRWSWEEDHPEYGSMRPVEPVYTPPPSIVTTPPCNRGGPGITPC